uniref:Uncharacterized protein n=1 Tax=Ignisphaera aggregans TaxID=334771 RepID=A0A7C2Z1T9_9CREN
MDGDGSDKDSDSLVLSSNHREKREALLKWLEEKLASKGFNVSRDAVVKGSIVKHRFDILAEQEVIPGLRLRLGILVVGDREVDENIVERLIAWREELFIDKIAIVPMKGVKPEALEIASRYGIDLITPDWGIISAMGIEREVAEGIAKTYSYIEPVLDAGRVVELVKKELRHQLFRRPKVELSGLTLVYLPLVVADVKSSRVDEASGEVEILTGRVVVDGIRGFAIRSKNSSIGVDEDIGNIVERSAGDCY